MEGKVGVRGIKECEMSSSREFVLAQYGAVRAEILYLQDANEKRTFAAVGFATSFWTALTAAIAAGIQMPAFIFIVPTIVLWLALRTHALHSKRVSNASSFLSHVTRDVYKDVVNWEFEIAQFARSSGIGMSAGVSTMTTYCIIVAVGCFGAVGLSVSRLLPWVEKACVSECGFECFDFVITLFLAISALIVTISLKNKYQDFSVQIDQFDEYWSSRITLKDSE